MADRRIDDEAEDGVDAGADGGEPGDGTTADGAPRRRSRRRRGRRGGRGRSRERGGSTEVTGGESAPAPASDDADDEPLPAGYGVRPRAPEQPRPGESSSPSDRDDRRGRRRRGRRRDGEPAAREGDRAAAPRQPKSETGSADGDSGRRRGRRGRRRSGEGRSEGSRSSGLQRSRRDDFAPVAGAYEEDDEGLEYLGIEDTGSQPRRDARRDTPDDDDVLAETGLNSVLDVPSWVEAIGIVIAGNLDARNRPQRGDDHDRGGRSRGGR